jgi:uncharacterized protein (DUF433 family)
VHWVRPELVAEVKFLAWTEDNLLRQVVYEGLREDKPAREVRPEVPRMIDWSIDWREWFDIQEPDSAPLIDWSQCPDDESVPGRCGGAWVIRGTRIPVQGLLDNAADCSPEQIAGPGIFPDLTVEQVRRVLRFAYRRR